MGGEGGGGLRAGATPAGERGWGTKSRGGTCRPDELWPSAAVVEEYALCTGLYPSNAMGCGGVGESNNAALCLSGVPHVSPEYFLLPCRSCHNGMMCCNRGGFEQVAKRTAGLSVITVKV